MISFGPPRIQLSVTKHLTTGSVNLSWTGGNAPYTLIRARDADFKYNPTTLVDHQTVATFNDRALGDGNSWFYLVR